MDAELSWIDPISLDYAMADVEPDRLLKNLRNQLRDAITDQGFAASDLRRCVYVIRVCGPVAVAYPYGDSPVLYIGRGDAPKRLASHLGNWLHAVHGFGKAVSVELRICIPRRRNNANLFKCVEADLIRWFQHKNGAVPFFNSKRERVWEQKVSYTPTGQRLLRQTLGVGSGNRPQWAIRPLPSNAAYDVFHKGFDPSVWEG